MPLRYRKVVRLERNSASSFLAAYFLRSHLPVLETALTDTVRHLCSISSTEKYNNIALTDKLFFLY